MKRKEKNRQACKIAVMEESAENIYSLRFMLQSLGYRVQAVELKPSLLGDLREFEPEVVLLDMMIQRADGFELLKALKASGLPFKRILAVTADAVPHTPEALVEAGADVVLIKPYTVAELQSILEGCGL